MKSLDSKRDPVESYCSIFKAERYYVCNIQVVKKEKREGNKGKWKFTTEYLNLLGKKRDSKGEKNTEKECSRKETRKSEAETVLRL